MYITDLRGKADVLRAQHPYVMIASPARTGSTLVYRVFLRFASLITPVKTHNIDLVSPNDMIVAVIRDPRDAMASVMKFNGYAADDYDNYYRYAHDVIPQYLALNRIKRNIAITLRYESFTTNSYNDVFDAVQRVCATSVSKAMREAVYKEVCVASTKKLSSELKCDHDPVEHVHRNHISDGAVGWRQLPGKARDVLCCMTRESCKLWGYTED